MVTRYNRIILNDDASYRPIPFMQGKLSFFQRLFHVLFVAHGGKKSREYKTIIEIEYKYTPPGRLEFGNEFIVSADLVISILAFFRNEGDNSHALFAVGVSPRPAKLWGHVD